MNGSVEYVDCLYITRDNTEWAGPLNLSPTWTAKEHSFTTSSRIVSFISSALSDILPVVLMFEIEANK